VVVAADSWGPLRWSFALPLLDGGGRLNGVDPRNFTKMKATRKMVMNVMVDRAAALLNPA
jgi:hypothetical protein